MLDLIGGEKLRFKVIKTKSCETWHELIPLVVAVGKNVQLALIASDQSVQANSDMMVFYWKSFYC